MKKSFKKGAFVTYGLLITILTPVWLLLEFVSFSLQQWQTVDQPVVDEEVGVGSAGGVAGGGGGEVGAGEEERWKKRRSVEGPFVWETRLFSF